MSHESVKFGLPGIDEDQDDSFVPGVYMVKRDDDADHGAAIINRIKESNRNTRCIQIDADRFIIAGLYDWFSFTINEILFGEDHFDLDPESLEPKIVIFRLDKLNSEYENFKRTDIHHTFKQFLQKHNIAFIFITNNKYKLELFELELHSEFVMSQSILKVIDLECKVQTEMLRIEVQKNKRNISKKIHYYC